MNQDNAVAEALADELEKLAAKAVPMPIRVRFRAGYLQMTRADDGIHLGNFRYKEDAALVVALYNNLPTIIAALKAQRVDEGGVS